MSLNYLLSTVLTLMITHEDVIPYFRSGQRAGRKGRNYSEVAYTNLPPMKVASMIIH